MHTLVPRVLKENVHLRLFISTESADFISIFHGLGGGGVQNEELRGVVVTRMLEEMFDHVGLPMVPPPPQLILGAPRPNDILPTRLRRNTTLDEIFLGLQRRRSLTRVFLHLNRVGEVRIWVKAGSLHILRAM